MAEAEALLNSGRDLKQGRQALNVVRFLRNFDIVRACHCHISPRQNQSPCRPSQKFGGCVLERRVNHGSADASFARPIQQKEGIPPEIWAGEDQEGFSIQRPRGAQFSQGIDLLRERSGGKSKQRKAGHAMA